MSFCVILLHWPSVARTCLERACGTPEMLRARRLTDAVLILVVVLAVSEAWDVRQHLADNSKYDPPHRRLPTPPSGCIPKFVYTITRHGSRYPFDAGMREYHALQAKIEEFLKVQCTTCPAWLREWTTPFDHETPGDLTDIGAREMIDLGRRMRTSAAYKPVFDQDYQPAFYPIHSSALPHTSRSAFAFGLGLFPSSESSIPSTPVYIDSSEACNDITVRFFKSFWWSCPGLKDNDAMHLEGEKAFGRLLQPIAERLTREWGTVRQWNVTVNYVNYMMLACSSEVALFNDTSRMCSLFTQSEIEDWEYCWDVVLYNSYGYGYPPSYESGAPLLRDIFLNLGHIIQGDILSTMDQYQLARTRVGHHQTLLALYALLGLYRDEVPLTWDLSRRKRENRKWRSSDMSPFAGNAQFILYECEEVEQDYRVRLLVNERDVKVPHCNATLCPWIEFWRPYQQALEDSFKTVCERHGGTYDNRTFEDICVEALPHTQTMAPMGGEDCSWVPGGDLYTFSLLATGSVLTAFLAGCMLPSCLFCCTICILKRRLQEPTVSRPIRSSPGRELRVHRNFDPDEIERVHAQQLVDEEERRRAARQKLDEQAAAESTDFSARMLRMQEEEDAPNEDVGGESATLVSRRS